MLGGVLVAVSRGPRSAAVSKGPQLLGNSARVHVGPDPGEFHTHEVRGSSPLAPTTQITDSIEGHNRPIRWQPRLVRFDFVDEAEPRGGCCNKNVVDRGRRFDLNRRWRDVRRKTEEVHRCINDDVHRKQPGNRGFLQVGSNWHGLSQPKQSRSFTMPFAHCVA